MRQRHHPAADAGWRDVKLMRVDATRPDYFEKVRGSLAPRFRDDELV